MKIGYMRINPLEEDAKNMILRFQDKTQVNRVYWEQMSVKGKGRPEYDKMMEYVREGDEIIVPQFSRFSRNLIELVKTIEQLNEKGIVLVSQNEDFNSATKEGQFKLSVLKLAAEFEKELRKERQREGIQAARAAGKYKGYNEKKVPEDFERFRELYYGREITVTDIAENYSVSRPTVYKWLKKLKEEKDKKNNQEIEKKRNNND